MILKQIGIALCLTSVQLLILEIFFFKIAFAYVVLIKQCTKVGNNQQFYSVYYCGYFVKETLLLDPSNRAVLLLDIIIWWNIVELWCNPPAIHQDSGTWSGQCIMTSSVYLLVIVIPAGTTLKLIQSGPNSLVSHFYIDICLEQTILFESRCLLTVTLKRKGSKLFSLGMVQLENLLYCSV